MDAQLAGLASTAHGVFYRWQALDCGYSPAEITALLRSGEWRRIRRGAYTTRERARGATATEWHLLTVRAAVGALSGDVVVMGTSALAALGVPLWGVDLDRVHVARAVSVTSRTDAGIVHHRTPLAASDVVEVAGLLVARPERAVVDAARSCTFEAGVVQADGALRLAGFEPERAEGVLDVQRTWRGSVRASRVLHFADGRAETVGESRSRVMLARIGLPSPQLQRSFLRSDGSLFARTDFYIAEHRTVGEFDGRQKYGRSMYETTQALDAVDLGQVLWLEKRREDELRDHGNEVVRWIWSELDGHDDLVAARFEAAFRRSARRTLPKTG